MGDVPVNIRGVLAFPNEEGGRKIRFIDSGYNTLFHVPDGGSIFFTTFDDQRKLLPCRYIDDYHAVIGNDTFHICEFAEFAQREGAVYAPEHPQEGDICDTYTIYQIKDTREIPYSFEPYDYARRKLWIGHYQRAYRGVLAPSTTLDDLFDRHLALAALCVVLIVFLAERSAALMTWRAVRSEVFRTDRPVFTMAFPPSRTGWVSGVPKRTGLWTE